MLIIALRSEMANKIFYDDTIFRIGAAEKDSNPSGSFFARRKDRKVRKCYLVVDTVFAINKVRGRT